MRIRKWYLDCTAPDGTVFIGYAGTLGSGPLALPVQSCALYPAGEEGPDARWRLGSATPTLDARGDVDWRAPGLDAAGVWTARSRPVSRVLLSTPHLRVEWRCHLPRGWARVVYGSHRLEGWGYVEEMVVDGDVRRLPLRELQWGRFLSDSTSVVWLAWTGSHPLTLLLLDGEETTGTVEPGSVHVDGLGSVPLPEPSSPGGPVRVLADQRVGDAFFPSLPPLRWILPRILAGLRERKLSGRGRIDRGPGRRAGEGWLLYERVEFP